MGDVYFQFELLSDFVERFRTSIFFLFYWHFYAPSLAGLYA